MTKTSHAYPEPASTLPARPFAIYGRTDVFCRLIDRPWTMWTYCILFLAYAALSFGSSLLIAIGHHRVADFFKERDWVINNAVLVPCFVVLVAYFCDALPRLYDRVQLAGDMAAHGTRWREVTGRLRGQLEGPGSWKTPLVALLLGLLLSLSGVWFEPSWKGLPAVRNGELSIWGFAWMRLVVTLDFYVIVSVTLRVAAIADGISQLLREPIRLRYNDPDNSCGLQPIAVIWLRMWLLVILGGASLLVYVLPGFGNGLRYSVVPSVGLIGIYLWFLLRPVLGTFLSARACLLRFRRSMYELSTVDPAECWKELHWNYKNVPRFSVEARDHWIELQETIEELPTMPAWWPRALVTGIVAWAGIVVALLEIVKALERSVK